MKQIVLALALMAGPVFAQTQGSIARAPCMVGLAAGQGADDDPTAQFISGWLYGASQTAARAVTLRTGERTSPIDVIGALVDRCRADPGMTFSEMMAIAGRF